MTAPTLTAEQVKAEAHRLGFIACGITGMEPLPHAEELDRWLASGFAGNMRYLHRQAKKRKDPRKADAEAVRAVVVLENYWSTDGSTDDQDSPDDCTDTSVKSSAESVKSGSSSVRIARYARGEDYHRVTRARLELLADFLRSHGARAARAYVDTGPIAERELAQRAGLGWIGKNTMLLRPGTGSWFFIGSVLTDLPLAIDPPFVTDHCGSCTRCLEACPTNALVEPRLLDATRCISYLTIEHKKEIPEEIVPLMSGYAFGCDICNEVCPWNQRFAEETSVKELKPRGVFDGAGPDFFERMDQETFERLFSDTPLSRPGLERMRRNWAAVHASLNPEDDDS
ncbi:MAG TPA: tRNA epoxyqueuosine(34) reductase QueG [Gemmatimonadales bacterium]|nr:tRNA epoxyqueuosine(34) reductase QueG [Gemmatimonadales bacterium]